MNKLIFIIDASESFLREEAIRIAHEWGFTTSTMNQLTEYKYTVIQSPVTLFGTRSMTHLDLSDKKDLKNFVTLIDKAKENNFFNDGWFGAGLVITATTSVGTKKIETLVAKSGGEVIKKIDPKAMSAKLLDRLKLNNATRRFVSEYAGEDYDMLISVIREIEKMTEEEQANLTPDELIVRLPGKPGAVPPWEFINPLVEGNTAKAVEGFKRTVLNSHVLVTMVFAKRKFELIYRLAFLRSIGVTDSKKMAEAIGEKNSPNIWHTDKVARRLSLETAEYLAKLTNDLEVAIKGGSAVDSEQLFINYIVTVCLSIKHNRAF